MGTIALGADGLELDTVNLSRTCHTRHHGHPVGAPLLEIKLDFLRQVRAARQR